MSSKQVSVFTAACALLLGILACTLPANTPPSQGGDAASITPQSSLLPTNTKTMAVTALKLTSTVAATATFTNTPTRTPTKTPLPPLPDFDDTLSFSAGGGGGQCPGLDQEPNSIDMTQRGQAITTCFWLSGFDFTQPFQIYLSQADGSGTRLVTPNLYLDSRDDIVQWDGYIESLGFGSWRRVNNGTLAVYNFNVWSPDRLSPGQWRFTISQKGSAFYEYSTDFWVEKDDSRPYITTLNSRSNELLPFDMGLWARSLSPKGNGKLDIRGVDFPPNIPIYILLYNGGPSRAYGDFVLVSKQIAQSNSSGSISAELSGPFKEGYIYLVIGLSDPNTPIVDMYLGFDEYPFDRFEVTYPTSNSFASSSCPGAPPQRMAVNQRGYVCTKGDNVRLRNAPKRSGAALDSLPVGTQFTVLDGPTCADNWSWWQIRTDYGVTGWIAEGGDEIDPYFICPLP